MLKETLNILNLNAVIKLIRMSKNQMLRKITLRYHGLICAHFENKIPLKGEIKTLEKIIWKRVFET